MGKYSMPPLSFVFKIRGQTVFFLSLSLYYLSCQWKNGPAELDLL
jgi:hypothetical protein